MMRYDRAPSLYQAYEPYFKIGAAITLAMTENAAYDGLISRHFNSITAENDMKPERVLDRRATLATGDQRCAALDFTRADQLLSFAQARHIAVRFHVLNWHNQTPRWFFAKDWSDDPDAPLADRETMLQRQANYTRDVMTHVNRRFPGTVYAWDVVNEAIEPDQGAPSLYRTRSLWYQILGPDFIPAAFRAARAYQAPGQKLYYNDYNSFEPRKRDAILALLRELHKENLVDGMGMQGHLLLDQPDISLCEEAARMYAALGLEIQATELDIHCPGQDAERQAALARRYGEYFCMLLRLRREGIAVTAATLWGVTDRDSWLTAFRKEGSWPLLFTENMETKPAFDAVLEAAG